MAWVWQHKDWAKFEYDSTKLHQYESDFLLNAGRILGLIQVVEQEGLNTLKVEILSQEALSTSSIEGEILDRDSVQSSIKKHLGLQTDFRRVEPNVAGIAEMMVDLFQNYDTELTHEMLFEWHKMLMNGRRDVDNIGGYRSHSEPMQIISGNLSNPRVFYEAPPSHLVLSEMDKFTHWYKTQLATNISTLAFAGITHLYFEMIHPFEDGNGRIGRALIEKAISQRFGKPIFMSMAKAIENRKKAYYEAIQNCNHQLQIDKYLAYFAQTVLESQEYTIQLIHFILLKVKLFNQFQSQLNDRQIRVLLRVFEAGIEGIKGGLSAKNYQSISQTSSATVTRDLQELVNLGILIKTGELKSTRYWLNKQLDI